MPRHSAWVVQANAYTQMGMAELLRLNSADVSNRSGALKDSTAQMQNINQRMVQILAPPQIDGVYRCNPGIFEFQSMMTSVVNGISGSLLTAVQSVAYVLMTICLVLGIYEAYVKGGDIRSLAGTFLKYAVAAFVIGNWTAFFSDLFTRVQPNCQHYRQQLRRGGPSSKLAECSLKASLDIARI